MTRTQRRLAILAASVAGAIVLVVLLLPYVVSLDAMRARVESAASASLHRKVEIRKMRLQILPGLGAALEGVAVQNAPGFEGPPLLAVDHASVTVAFWPLLSRRIEVRRLALDGPTISVQRNAEGKLSVEDFLSAGRRESAPATRTAAAVLLFSRIEIDRGRAVFLDDRASPGQRVALSLDDVTARVRDIRPDRPARFETSARLLADGGRNLSLQGSLGPPPASGPLGEAPLDARFAARNVALGRLAPWVSAFRSADPGTFFIEGNAKGKLLGAVEIAAKLGLEPAASAKMPVVDGTVALTLDWPRGTLVVGRSIFDVAELPLAVEGRVDELRKTPVVNLRVGTPGEVGLDHVTGLPGIAGRFPENVKLAGKIRLDLQIQGTVAAVEIRGSADAAPLAVVMDGQPVFEAPSVGTTVSGTGTEALSGRVTATVGKLKRLPFEDLKADWTWHGGSLVLSPSARVYGGTLTGRVESDFTRPGSESRIAFEADGVQVQPLVEATTTAQGVISGTLAGKIALTSRGLGWDAIVKTGRGEGRVALSDADLRTVHLMPEVARSLSAVGKVAGFGVPASLEDTRFSRLETSLRLADGRVATPDLTLSGRDVSASADGSLGLDKTLAYQGRVVLGPSLVKSFGNAGRYLADTSGRLALPFRAAGTIAASSVSIDPDVVLELGRHALARGAGDALGGAAGKAVGDILGGGDGKKTNPLDLLQRMLGAPAPTPTPR